MATILFRLTLLFLITFWGSLGVVAIALNILLHPLSFFYWKKREGQPESDCIYDNYYNYKTMCIINSMGFACWSLQEFVYGTMEYRGV